MVTIHKTPNELRDPINPMQTTQVKDDTTKEGEGRWLTLGSQSNNPLLSGVPARPREV